MYARAWRPAIGWPAHARRLWRRNALTISYLAVLLIVAVVLQAVGARERADIVAMSSTNLTNLQRRPIFVLIVSAFLVPSVFGLYILVPLACSLGWCERWLGRASTVVIFLMGHVGATLMVAAIQASHLYHDRVDASIREAADVGVSYGMFATFGLLVARVPTRRRPYYIAGGFLLVVALGRHVDFTALGHVTALLLGLLVAVIALAARRAPVTQPPTALSSPAPEKIEISRQSGAVDVREGLGSRSP